MITGEIKSRIDSIWDTFFAGGITNPMTVLEQMTYLFFMKMLDDAQKTKEANANIMGVAVKDPTFREGMWHNPDMDKDVPYETLRWSVLDISLEVVLVKINGKWYVHPVSILSL